MDLISREVCYLVVLRTNVHSWDVEDESQSCAVSPVDVWRRLLMHRLKWRCINSLVLTSWCHICHTHTYIIISTTSRHNLSLTHSLPGQFFPECHPRVWFSFTEVPAGYVLWCQCTAEIHVLNDEYTSRWHLTMHFNWRDNSSVAVNVLILAQPFVSKISYWSETRPHAGRPNWRAKETRSCSVQAVPSKSLGWLPHETYICMSDNQTCWVSCCVHRCRRMTPPSWASDRARQRSLCFTLLSTVSSHSYSTITSNVHRLLLPTAQPWRLKHI